MGRATRALALVLLLPLAGCATAIATRSWTVAMALGGEAQAAAGATVDLQQIKPTPDGQERQARAAEVNVCGDAVPAAAAQGSALSPGVLGLAGTAAGYLLAP